MYNVTVKESAEKTLHHFPAQDTERIVSAITVLQSNPRPIQSAKLAGHPNAYRLRKGDYRVLYTIDDRAKLVTVYRVAHRREAYR